MAAVLAITANAGAAATCSQNGNPNRDINSYVLFGYEQLTFKGKNSDPTGGEIRGGNVGVNNFVPSNGDPNIPDPNENELALGVNGTVKMDPGTQVVANRAGFGNGSTSELYTVFANEYNNNLDPSIIKTAGPLCWTLPLVSNLPIPPVATPSADDRTVNSNDTLALTPGSYGAIDLKDDSVLTFQTAGVYNLRSLKAGKNVTINTGAGVDVRIDEFLRVNNDAKIIGSDLAKFTILSNNVPSNQSTVMFSKGDGTADNNEIHGQFWAPNGTLNLGHSTVLVGRFWAKKIGSDWDVNITYRAPDSVSGKKYLASTNSAPNGSEQGLGGFTFYIDVNNNQTFDSGEPSAVSAADGSWSIGTIQLQGTYNVREVQRSGYTCAFPGACSYTVDLQGTGTNYGGNDFGNKPDTTCVPQPGQDANCQPVVVKCVPVAGQDANCQPVKPGTPVTPKKVTDSARISGPSGCVSSSSVRVSGSNIKQVTFTYNGKRKVVKKSPFSLKIKKNQLKRGANKIVAKVVFKDGKRETERLTVQRCGSNAVLPQFTG